MTARGTTRSCDGRQPSSTRWSDVARERCTDPVPSGRCLMGQLLLVRHGQASWGADDYDVLSPLGWEQSRMLGQALSERALATTVIIQGPMRRHRGSGNARGREQGG